MSVTRIILAEYFTTVDGTLLFLVREDFPEPKVFEIKTSQEEVRQFVAHDFARMKNYYEEDIPDTWQSLFGPLIEPIISWSDEGDLIWLVPHDALHYLPLHALKIEQDTRYLIERNPVCYTPSASVMSFCRAKRKNRRANALVLGDSLHDLLYAYEEAFSVASLFGTTPYVREQATKSRVKDILATSYEELDVLHFSCHGLFDDQHPLQSGIRLAPESQNGDSADNASSWNLTAEEIFSLRLRADLVTLSACDTGLNEQKPGDELIGLTRALIYAGTPSVIVSLWTVDAFSTSLLMHYFYQQLLAPIDEEHTQLITKAEALQLAQLYVKNLTAQHVVDYCNQRLMEQSATIQREQALSFYMGRAYAQTIAGDLEVALSSYQEIQNQLQTFTTPWAQQLNTELQFTTLILQEKARTAVDRNYQAQPFKSIAHWAPFILVGDWK